MNMLLSIPASGLSAESSVLGAVAANVANWQTPGYGARRVETAAMADQTLRPANTSYAGQVVPPPWTVSPGAKLLEDIPVFGSGIVPSASPTHLAINGDGFFQVTDPNGGVLYTRAGTFQRDASGQWVLPNGYRLNPPITTPAGTPFRVESDGRVTSTVNGKTTTLGQIRLARFPNPAGLLAAGANCYRASANSGTPVVGPPGQGGVGSVMGGSLNASGVDLAQTFGRMVQAQTLYQMNAKAEFVAQTLMQRLDNLTV